MKGLVDGGVAILELKADELRTLFIAVDHEAGHQSHMAALCEQSSEERQRMSETNRKGRTANRRLAGELRDKAAGHKALARDALDLRRVLHQLTRDPEVK